MKVESHGNKSGSMAIELLIAVSILVLSLGGIVLVAFGNQSASLDTELHTQALLKAARTMETARAEASIDFDSLRSASSEEGIYGIRVNVTDIKECVKKVTSRVDWSPASSRQIYIELNSLISSSDKVFLLGEKCSGMELDPDEWRAPTSLFSIDIEPSGSKANGLDVVNKIVFLASSPTGNDKPNFFVINTTDLADVRMYSLNTYPGDKSTLNAVDSANGYAYVANNHVYEKVAGVDHYNEQLQIIDVSDITTPTLVKSITLPGVDPDGGQPWGKSIFYYDNKVYVGLEYTAGPELHIYDVHTPAIPTHLGSFNVQSNVNGIVVRGNYAYLATSESDSELKIFNVENPASISLLNELDLSGIEPATSIFVLGDRAYVGRKRTTVNSAPDFDIVDISQPQTPHELSSINLEIAYDTEVSGIRVTGNIAFIGTTDSNTPFQVWDISEPSAPVRYEVDPLNFSENTTGVDYEDNLIYVSNRSNNSLRVLQSTP